MMEITYSKQAAIKEAREAKLKFEAEVIALQAEYASLPWGDPRRIGLLRNINFTKTKVEFHLGVINRLNKGQGYLGQVEGTVCLESKVTNTRY